MLINPFGHGPPEGPDGSGRPDGGDRPENIRGTIGWIILVYAIGYFAVNAFLPNNDTNIGVGAHVVGFSTMVLVFYAGRSLKALVTGSAEYSDYLIVGICLSWFATETREIVVIIARLADVSPTLLNSELLILVKLLYPIAAVCHVVPRGAIDGQVPEGTVRAVIITFVLSSALAFVLLALKPDTAILIEGLPWWVKDLWGTGQAALGASAAS